MTVAELIPRIDRLRRIVKLLKAINEVRQGEELDRLLARLREEGE